MTLIALCIALCAEGTHMPSDTPQYSFTIWDWDSNYRDFAFYQRQVDACVRHGFNTIELGAAWADCEPVEGSFDFTLVDDRVGYVASKGLAIRLRVNVKDWPAWFDPELFTNPDGAAFEPGGGYPSVFDSNNRERQLRFVAKLAEHFRGKGFTYTPAFSVHMEVKFSDWNTYEPSARNAFQDWLAGKYESIRSLNRAWQSNYGRFSEIVPSVPGQTAGQPASNAAEADWIRFREWGLREWVAAFAGAVRDADASARISVPLGEAFRRQSAAFANQDYWGYSRNADEVVHSYDFFWHGPDGLDHVPVAVATMRGIAQRPVIFEIDGPYVIENHGYTRELFIEAGARALDAGAAGVQVTNWGSVDIANEDWLSELGRRIHDAEPVNEARQEALYYVSKWTNYSFREADEWVHDRQFAFWRRLRDDGVPTRIVTDENILSEDLEGTYFVVPFAPVMDEPAREKLRIMSHGIRVVADERPGVHTPENVRAGNTGGPIDVAKTPFADDPRPAREILGGPAKTLRVAAVQFASTFDVKDNTARILAFLKQAAEQKVRVAIFPEMALTGYTKRKEFRDTLDWSCLEASLAQIQAACKDLGLYAVVGAPQRDGDALFVAAYAFTPEGEIADIYEKTYLAGEQWAVPGRHLTTFSVDGVPSGTFICHDSRYGPLVQLRALSGTRLFFYISCESGLEDGHKLEPYRAQIQARAVENGVYIVHANTPANRDDPGADGQSHGESRIVAPDGNLIIEAGQYEETMIVADIRPDAANKGGMPQALTSGTLVDWMRQGVSLVEK